MYAVPCVPAVRAQGGVPQVGAVITTGRAATVRETAREVQLESVSHACTENRVVPDPVGVPEMLQFVLSPQAVLESASPAGSVPLEIVHV